MSAGGVNADLIRGLSLLGGLISPMTIIYSNEYDGVR